MWIAVYFINDLTGKSQWDKPTGPAEALTSVRASHLLVKHTGSRRPASWRQDPITLTKEQARERLLAFHKEIIEADNPAEKLAELASTESDCSSAKRGGDLGDFGPGMMQKAFEDAAFGLSVGEVSGVVDSDSGLHIVIRTA